MSIDQTPDLAHRVFNALNTYLVGGPGCPGKASRGECSAIEYQEKGGFIALCSWWPEPPLPASDLARTVREAGGCNITIELTLWDDWNGVAGGRDYGGCYGFSIQFHDPAKVEAVDEPADVLRREMGLAA